MDSEEGLVIEVVYDNGNVAVRCAQPEHDRLIKDEEGV